MAVRLPAGLPAVVPALPLYELLFEAGHERPAVPVPADSAARVSAWLGLLAGRARNVLVSGIRLPQEAVGYELLSTRPDVLDRV